LWNFPVVRKIQLGLVDNGVKNQQAKVSEVSMKPVWRALLSVAVLTLGAIPALAQPIISAKSGVVSYVMGKVTVDEKVVEPSETKLTEIKENAVLRTEEGRAEVLLTLGTILRSGENASFKMLTNRLIDTRLELLSGSHIVEVAEVQKDNNLTIAAKDATVTINKKGLYRFDVDQSQIKVYEGVLGVQLNGQNVLVGTGKMVGMSGTSASVAKFDKEDTDALDHWAKHRAERIAMANASSAKQVHDYGCASNSFTAGSFAAATNPSLNSPCSNPCASWRYNPWYGLITYIPCGNNIYSPYGYRYWSPYNVMRAYYVPPAPVYNRGGGGGFGGGNAGYSGMSQTSAGYSGAMSTSSAGVSSPSAGAMSGSTGSASAGASSGGHGAAGGHGR
jgi:hypothetical protein